MRLLTALLLIPLQRSILKVSDSILRGKDKVRKMAELSVNRSLQEISRSSDIKDLGRDNSVRVLSGSCMLS